MLLTATSTRVELVENWLDICLFNQNRREEDGIRGRSTHRTSLTMYSWMLDKGHRFVMVEGGAELMTGVLL